MKPQTFGLVSDSAIADFVHFVNPIWRGLAKAGTPIIVKISTKGEDITSAQRRLYWQWITQFANHFGDDNDMVHHDMKKRFLIMIYYRDDPEFAKMCDAVKQLETSEPIIWQTIREHVIKETSITKASKEQMSEYMDKFFKFAQSQGLIMRCPDDLKYLREMEGR